MKKIPQKRWMSLWRHFYNRERTAEELTASMIEWQEKWNWDLMKVNPAACYHVLDWGAEYRFFEDGLTEPELVRPVIVHAEDVSRIGWLDVTRGYLGEQLQVIRNLRSHFGPELPIVETVFSPIEIAHRLMQGREQLQMLRRESPQAVHHLLDQISKVFADFCLKCLEAGADGIFFATKWASGEYLSWEEYLEFGKRYEEPIFDVLNSRDALLILHVCGSNTYLQEMLDYPADIFSYDFYAAGSPQPEDVLVKTGRFVLGGIDPNQLDSEPQILLEQCSHLAKWKNWLIGPSCVIPVTTQDESIDALRRAFLPLL